MKYLILVSGVLFMTAFNAFGSLLFKKTMIRVKKFSLKQTFTTPILYIGILSYALGSVSNIMLMHFFDYSTVYPLTSITCIWTLLFSCCLLKEKMTVNKFIGTAFIIIGAFLLCV